MEERFGEKGLCRACRGCGVLPPLAWLDLPKHAPTLLLAV